MAWPPDLSDLPISTDPHEPDNWGAKLLAHLTEIINEIGGGAWTAYTPTIGGSGWALGNGTIIGFYEQVGKTVRFQIRFTFGSTTTFGASAAPTFTVPVTGVSSVNDQLGANLVATATWRLDCRRGTTTTCIVSVAGTNGQISPLTATSPVALAAGNLLNINGEYQAA